GAGDDPLVDDSRVKAEVDLPVVWIRRAVVVAVRVPVLVPGEQHLATVAGGVAVDLVRARRDGRRLDAVGLTRVGSRRNRREAERGGVVEVRVRSAQVERDGLAIAGD